MYVYMYICICVYVYDIILLYNPTQGRAYRPDGAEEKSREARARCLARRYRTGSEPSS